MNKIKVLLADAHALFREGIRSVIEHEKDMEVIGETGGGAEAIELVTKLQPDVVLMDISMPGLNGLEATRQIKSGYPPAAILILTSDDGDQQVVPLLRAGATGYLLKNLSGADLINAIHAVHAGESVLYPTAAQKMFSRLATGGKQLQNQTQETELSEREIEILKLAARGMGNQSIATQLYLSHRTVQAHLANIFRKMDVGSRSEAVIHALRKGWLGLDDLN
jgi:two-component system, NarL family, response regulator LiaR